VSYANNDPQKIPVEYVTVRDLVRRREREGIRSRLVDALYRRLKGEAVAAGI
jgi:hypothetical protein